MATKLIESAILDTKTTGVHNHHSDGANCKTRPFAKVHGSRMSRIARNYKFYDVS